MEHTYTATVKKYQVWNTQSSCIVYSGQTQHQRVMGPSHNLSSAIQYYYYY